MLWLVTEITLKDKESHTVWGRRKMDCQHPWTSDPQAGRVHGSELFLLTPSKVCSYDPQLLFRAGPPEGRDKKPELLLSL